MMQRRKENEFWLKHANALRILGSLVLAFAGSSCAELERPTTEPFFSQTAPPSIQEFRWCNGKMPKTLDPARALAPPETDLARALFEGLTEHDSKTLEVLPAAATKWTSSKDFKTWTFTLRQKAKWSNGESVTAQDFVESWRRLSRFELGSQNGGLVSNIVGFETKSSQLVVVADAKEPMSKTTVGEKPTALPGNEDQTPTNETEDVTETPTRESDRAKNSVGEKEARKVFGVEAIDDHTLRVSLVQPDKDFPSLVAHPIFRPVYSGGREFDDGKLSASATTNGAFRITSIGADGITLDRSENYWNREDVLLQRVRFVPAESAELALAAYKAGEIDAVTNAEFEPLVLKLLAPFEDFRKTRHAALNLYEFNLSKPPFDDLNVREALSIAIERTRITNDEMEGASFPAERYLPFDSEKKFEEHEVRARELLAKSGYENGKGFPAIKLLINRNDLQKRVARAVAQMWKTKLNVETEIVTMDQAALDSARATGNFDMVRRGVVFQSTDEMANMLTIFGGGVTVNAKSASGIETKRDPFIITDKSPATDSPVSNTSSHAIEGKISVTSATDSDDKSGRSSLSLPIISENRALEILPAIPLYFPSSYALVKPYVKGFEMNVLDSVVLHGVSIESDWKSPKEK